MSTYGISTEDTLGHSNISLKDRVRGTLIGGAIGDAYLIWMGFQEGIAVDRKYDSKLAKIEELNQRLQLRSLLLEMADRLNSNAYIFKEN